MVWVDRRGARREIRGGVWKRGAGWEEEGAGRSQKVEEELSEEKSGTISCTGEYFKSRRNR